MSDYKLNTEEWQGNWVLELDTKDTLLMQNYIPFWIRMWTLESDAYISNTGLLTYKLFNIAQLSVPHFLIWKMRTTIIGTKLLGLLEDKMRIMCDCIHVCSCIWICNCMIVLLCMCVIVYVITRSKCLHMLCYCGPYVIVYVCVYVNV